MEEFAPDATCTWHLVSLNPDEPDLAYGLADLGLGCPALGSVRVSELKSRRDALGLPPERDIRFMSKGEFGWYADKARRFGSVCT